MFTEHNINVSVY